MPLLAWLRRHYPALEHPPYARLLWATALSSLGSQFTVLALYCLGSLVLIPLRLDWRGRR